MTYRQLRQITLQKLFATMGGQQVQDDATADYLYSLPAAANEGMVLLALNGQCKTKCLSFTAVGGTAVELTDMAPSFMQSVGGLYKKVGNAIVPAENWHIMGSTAQVSESGEYLVYYKARPKPITDNTKDDEEMDVPEEAAVLLPLYIAAQLYKEDDISIATGYRNEFELGLEVLHERCVEAEHGFTQTAGWC